MPQPPPRSRAVTQSARGPRAAPAEVCPQPPLGACGVRAHVYPAARGGASATPARDAWRDRAEDAIEESQRLKRELVGREDELQVIRARFARIVSELQRRDAAVADEEGDPAPPALNRGRPEDRDAEQYIAQLQRRLRQLRDEKDDLRRHAAVQQRDAETWQKKYRRAVAEALRRQAPHPVPAQPVRGERRRAGVPRGAGGKAANALAPELALDEQRIESPGRMVTVGVGGTPVAGSPPRDGREAAGSPAPSARSSGLVRTLTLPTFRPGSAGRAATTPTPHGRTTPARSSLRRAPARDAATSPHSALRGALPDALSPRPVPSPRAVWCAAAPPAPSVHSDAQTCPWADLLAFERAAWEAERPAAAAPAPVPSGVLDALQRENAALEDRLGAAADRAAAAEARCTRAQDERDMLLNAAAGGDAAPGSAADAERRREEELRDLREEVAGKNAQLVLLDARFRQAASGVEDLKRANTQILEEMRRLNDALSTANQRAMEAENAAQMAQVGQGRVDQLEARLRDKDQEVLELMGSNRQLLATCHSSRAETESSLRREWEGQLEERQRAVEEAERNNRTLFRESQVQEQQLHQLRQDTAKSRRERDSALTDVAQLREEVRDLNQRLRLFGQGGEKVSEEDEADVHKALALIKLHRQRGDPDDIEFLMATWDSGAAELGDLRAENLRLLREVEESRKLLKVWQQRASTGERRADGLQRAQEHQKRLTAVQRDQIWKLQADAARAGVRVTADSDASSVAAGDGENVVELGIGHLRAEPRFFEHPDGAGRKPPTFFVSAGFLDFETCVTDGAAGMSPTFGATFCFTVQVGAALLHYVKHDAVDLELHQQMGLSCEVVGVARLELRALLAPGCTRHSGHVRFAAPGAGGDEVAELEYHLALKAPLPPAWHDGAETESSPPSELGAAPPAAAPAEQWRGVSSLRVSVLEARDLHRAAAQPPVPYVLVTVVAGGAPLSLRDATAELPAPVATHRPCFRWEHDWQLGVDAALLRGLAEAVVHFVVLDDAARDPRAPPLGRAELPLAPLLAGPAHSVDTTLPLLQPRGNGLVADVGAIDVGLRWVRDPIGVGGFGSLTPTVTA